MKRLFFSFLFTIILSSLFAQNTLKLRPGYSSPPASIEDISWLAGNWRGEAFGGIVEEVWSPPLAGSMMGAFKATTDGKVNFYEIETISEENNSLILRLKHFHPDLKGWEEKNETVDFPLVKLTEDKVYFEGFTIERVSKKAINMYVLIEGKEAQEVVFKYTRFKK